MKDGERIDAAAKPAILFVDDEENILSGLRRLMRVRRAIWDIEFANSGAAGLAVLAQRRIDVVVSDMRMPEMDGAEFLAEVRRLYPETIRIILSGFANREAILRTIGPSHRYLSKPCSEEVLIGAIESALSLRASISSDNVRRSLSGLDQLPSLPKVYTHILDELSSEYASADTLSHAIEHDIAVSAQLLKLTNSSYFGTAKKISTVKQAVQFLGFENVRAVVLMAGVFGQFRSASLSATERVEQLARRSLMIGVLSRKIAEAESQTVQGIGEAFSAGLLAHIGTLYLIASSIEKFEAAISQKKEENIGIEAAERAVFGASHAEVGAYLLNLWGFNHDIIEAVARHHAPALTNSLPNNILTYVHVAQGAVRDAASERWVDTAYLEKVGAMSRLPVWMAMAKELKAESKSD